MAETEDKSTQEPDILNIFLKQLKKTWQIKKPIPMMNSKNNWCLHFTNQFKKVQKQRTIKRRTDGTSKNSSNTKNDEEGIGISDVEDFISRNATRGFRLAQALGNVALTTGNVVGTATELTLDTLMSLYNLSQQQQEESDEEEQQEAEQPSGSTDQPTFTRERSRSHDSDLDLGERLLHRGASRSRSSTPDRGYPKKKYK